MRSLMLFFCIVLLTTSYPQKVYKTIGSVEYLSSEMNSLVRKNARIEVIAEGFDWSEGPVWVEKERMLLFSDVPKNTIYKWTERRGTEVYLTPSGYTGTEARGGETGSNGLALSRDGKLLMAQHGDRRIAMMNAPLNAPRPDFISVADNYNGKKFNSPNDLTISRKGIIYFTDPPYGLEKYITDPKKEIPFEGVYKVNKDGKITLLTDTLTRPNGIALTPDEKTLIVANSGEPKRTWYAFDVTEDGTVRNGRIYYDATDEEEKGGPDGLKIDKQGNVFATGPGGVWVFNKNGKVIGKLKIPEATSNCALSPDEKTLYITADMYVLRVKMR
ncbi:MAG: SMP-30/gluconolactonase/LRE family protein [Bacteroidota bacterium]|nr:SMP-30/gluconolactonase/LRE family protein [Bacteroidota bacterium]